MVVGLERRAHPRVSVNLLVQYRFDTFETFTAEYIQDISEGGLSVREPEVMRPVGTTVHLQFVLRGGAQLIEGLSKVTRMQETPTRVMAFEFVDFDDESRAMIRTLVRDGPAADPPTEDLPFGAL